MRLERERRKGSPTRPPSHCLRDHANGRLCEECVTLLFQGQPAFRDDAQRARPSDGRASPRSCLSTWHSNGHRPPPSDPSSPPWHARSALSIRLRAGRPGARTETIRMLPDPEPMPIAELPDARRSASAYCLDARDPPRGFVELLTQPRGICCTPSLDVHRARSRSWLPATASPGLWLHEHMIQQKYLVRYNWNVGDLGFWDNRATMALRGHRLRHPAPLDPTRHPQGRAPVLTLDAGLTTEMGKPLPMFWGSLTNEDLSAGVRPSSAA